MSDPVTAITRNDEFVDREMVLKSCRPRILAGLCAVHRRDPRHQFNFYDFLGHVPWLTWDVSAGAIMGVVFAPSPRHHSG